MVTRNPTCLTKQLNRVKLGLIQLLFFQFPKVSSLVSENGKRINWKKEMHLKFSQKASLVYCSLQKKLPTTKRFRLLVNYICEKIQILYFRGETILEMQTHLMYMNLNLKQTATHVFHDLWISSSHSIHLVKGQSFAQNFKSFIFTNWINTKQRAGRDQFLTFFKELGITFS